MHNHFASETVKRKLNCRQTHTHTRAPNDTKTYQPRNKQMAMVCGNKKCGEIRKTLCAIQHKKHKKKRYKKNAKNVDFEQLVF